MKTEPNDPMQPCEVHTENGEQYYAQTGQYSHMLTGLTKREYFAGLAMQGMIANEHTGGHGEPYINIAHNAIGYADALIAELNKSES